MKILHVVHGFPPEFYGGTELYVQRLAHAQQALGHEVEILCGTISRGEPGIETFEHEALVVHHLRRDDLFFERWDRGASGQAGAFFDALIAERRPDLVHVHHWIRLTRDLLRRARAAGIPTVLTCHDLYPSCPRVFRVREEASFCELELDPEHCAACAPKPDWMSDTLARRQVEWFRADFRRELAQACAILAPSRALAEALARFTGVAPGRFELLQHATLVQWPAPEVAPAWTPQAGRPLVLAHWGHLLPAKGVHLLLEALRGLECPVELELWGRADDPAYGALLEELADGLLVRRREDFDREDLPQLRADVAVFPSIAYESYSFVVDEAFALGLPILVSGRGALPERCGGAGLVFAPDDAESLRAALRRVLSGEADIAAMRAQIPPRRSMQQHAERLQEIYARVASELQIVPATARLPEEGRVLRATEELARSYFGETQQLRSELGHGRRAFADLERSVADFRARIAELEQDLASHRARKTEVDEDLAAHRTRLRELEGDLEAHRLRKSELEEDLQAHRTRMEEQEADLNAHRQRKSELEAELLDHRAELARIRGEYEQVESWLRDAVQRETQYQASIAELSHAREELQKHASTHEEQLAGSRRDLEDSSRLLDEQAQALRASEERLRELLGELETLVAERDRWHAERELAREEKSRLERQHEELQTETARLRAENRFAFPLVVLARGYMRIRDRIRKKP